MSVESHWQSFQQLLYLDRVIKKLFPTKCGSKKFASILPCSGPHRLFWKCYQVLSGNQGFFSIIIIFKEDEQLHCLAHIGVSFKSEYIQNKILISRCLYRANGNLCFSLILVVHIWMGDQLASHYFLFLLQSYTTREFQIWEQEKKQLITLDTPLWAELSVSCNLIFHLKGKSVRLPRRKESKIKGSGSTSWMAWGNILTQNRYAGLLILQLLVLISLWLFRLYLCGHWCWSSGDGSDASGRWRVLCPCLGSICL